MTDPIPGNPGADELISAASPFGPSPAVEISALQPAVTIELIPPQDQIALELKALRQQALSTQAGIQQLQLEQQNQPLANALSGLTIGLTPGTSLLGIVILILGGMLTWSGAQRLRTRFMGSQPEFIDSYSPADDPQDSATLAMRESARVVAAALQEAPSTLPTESEFPPDSTGRELACDLDVNLENLLPIKAPDVQALISAPKKPVVNTNHPPEFDREAAADEVERVLKSLASKRAARSRRPQRSDSAIAPEQNHAMMILPPFDPATGRHRAANQDLTGQEAAPSPDQSAPDFQTLLPLVPTATPGQDADDEPNHEVQLSLAHEFEALGLTHGARELATEVLDSPNTTLSSYAQALLRQIEDQELADPGTPRSIF